MWVFINRKLAVDLGGIHTPVIGTVVIGANGNGSTTVTATYPISPPPVATQSTATLGLVSGQVYEIAVFQAERQTTSSSFKLTMTGFNAAPSQCAPCTSGITPGGEPCGSGTGGAGGGGAAGASGGSSGGVGGTVASGGVVATGGIVGAGGSSYIGASGITTSPFGGSAGGDSTTDTSAGGAGDAGGAGGSGDVPPPPASGLQVWLNSPISGTTGSIKMDLRIDNKTPASADLSSVTLRYWYQDEGLGTALMFSSDFVSIGQSNAGTMVGHVVTASPSAPGATTTLNSRSGGLLRRRVTRQTTTSSISRSTHTPRATRAQST